MVSVDLNTVCGASSTAWLGTTWPTMQRCRCVLGLVEKTLLLCHALPIVLLAPEESHGCHAEEKAPKIADGDIQDPRVPPALVEVEEPVLERELHELEADGAHPQHPVVAHDDGLANPAERVGDYELIKQRLLQDLPVDAFSGDPQSAITSVSPLWQISP